MKKDIWANIQYYRSEENDFCRANLFKEKYANIYYRQSSITVPATCVEHNNTLVTDN